MPTPLQSPGNTIPGMSCSKLKLQSLLTGSSYGHLSCSRLPGVVPKWRADFQAGFGVRGGATLQQQGKASSMTGWQVVSTDLLVFAVGLAFSQMTDCRLLVTRTFVSISQEIFDSTHQEIIFPLYLQHSFVTGIPIATSLETSDREKPVCDLNGIKA